MKYIHSFDDIDENQLKNAGGKGTSLVKLRKAGLCVPKGYIILADALEGRVLCGEANAELQSVCERLSNHYTYAVRSSALNEDGANASFAGAYETITDVKKDDIAKAVETVAASAEKLRVKAYADCIHSTESKIAIVIQRFVKPKFAGVLFTSDIITGSGARMQGNYVHGEGEQLVSGSANAEEFFFDTMKYNYHGNREIQAYARRLFRCANKILRLYGCPMDIEWAVSRGKLYILQARPITTLQRFYRENYEINGSLSGEYLLSKTNVGEIFMSTVSPMTYSMLESICMLMGVPCFLDNICGQAYCNVSVVCSLLMSFGVSKKKAMSLISDIAGKIPEGVDVPVFPFDRKSFLKSMSALAFGGKKKSSMKMSKAEFLNKIPELSDEIIITMRCIDNNADLLNYWDTTCSSFMPKVMNTISALFPVMKPFLNTGKKLTAVAGEELATELCAGSMGILESMKPLYLLEDVIHGNLSREEYIKCCGHRSVYEMELAEAYPYENPEFPDNLVANHIESGVDVHKMQEEREQLYKEAVAKFKAQYPNKAHWFDTTIAKFVEADQIREEIRSKAVRLFCILREFLLKAAQLNDVGDDIFMLYFSEVMDLLKGDTSVLTNIAARKENYEKYRTYPAFPNVVLGRFEPEKWMENKDNRLDFYSANGETSGSADIVGFAGAAGIVTGSARVITDLSDANMLQKGEILVTTATNIGWTVIFPMAAAVVTDIGAPLSHAAIVAREFGIPAVVGCQNATTLIKTGDLIKVNGSAGLVEKI